MSFRYVDAENAGLLTDLYELTMLQAYWREGLSDTATFSLFVRSLPRERNFLLACGLDDVLTYLEALHLNQAALDCLAERKEFSRDFLRWLSGLRFTGDVYALDEGTPFFAQEPVLEVVAPIAEGQLVETFLVNQIHLQTMLASQAARCVAAAGKRPVIDFGLRRLPGTDAGLKAARAFFIAGVQSTSNVLASCIYGVPVSGTMAHSYVQAHDRESDAFREFAKLYPESVLLVDTYDTLDGVRKVVRLSEELGDRFRVRAIRLDSGDLASLSREARVILDRAGLQRVAIFASGGLDEYRIDALVRAAATIDGFGVGLGLGYSAGVTGLDAVYKLTEYAHRGRLKLSTKKEILPGRKQVFRAEAGAQYSGDVIGRADEKLPGRPLLSQVMARGRRLPVAERSLALIRAHARDAIGRLPAAVRALEPLAEPYPVSFSEALSEHLSETTRVLAHADEPAER